MRPREDASNLSAYRANTVSKDLSVGECKQNVNRRLELSHKLNFAISVPKVVESLRFLLKNVEYCIWRGARSELDGDRIGDNVLPRLPGVLLQGSIEDRLELRRRCGQGGVLGHNACTKTRWTLLKVDITTCWGCICAQLKAVFRHCPKYSALPYHKNEETEVCELSEAEDGHRLMLA